MPRYDSSRYSDGSRSRSTRSAGSRRTQTNSAGTWQNRSQSSSRWNSVSDSRSARQGNPARGQSNGRQDSGRGRGTNVLEVNRDGKIRILLVVLVLMAVIACARCFWLTVVDAQSNLDRGSNAVHTSTIEARRGTIYDCNGTILATTVDAINIFCHPHVIKSSDVDKLANWLSEHCGGEASDYVSKITSDQNFQYLFKGADADLATSLKELGIDGLDYEDTVKRVYPCGKVGSQVIGLLNTEGTALSGLELYYDSILAGSDGKRTIAYSADGVPVPGSESIETEAVAGKDIVVSLDVEMQQELENAMELNVKKIKGDTAAGMIMDADTGAIVACAGCPTFDITDTSTIVDGSTNLNAISGSYEPGSVFKPVIMLAALQEGTTSLDKSYYCPVKLTIGEDTISDSHDRGAEDMTTTQIIADSSNVGMSLIAKELGADAMYKYIQQYKITDKTGVDYPGEVKGSITDPSTWSKVQQYNIAFGQGVITTPVELVRFYGALANGGTNVTPHFLVSVPADGGARTYSSEKIIDNAQAIEDVTEMMTHVVSEGTATDAKIDGYTIAGKTGTAQTIQDGAYIHDVYNVSFCGFLPGASKNLVCYVGATNVPGMYQTVSAFKDIMTFAIDRYNISQE